eukprot:GHVU01224031.1.p1 GENE.GHVU01224031.1~~GHVU01224031.1.p1  ORF type:complete len:412 (-),score=59.80 GHVU01224031.1:19-1254(-)
MSLYALPVSSDPRGHSYVARSKPNAGGQRNRGVDEGRVAGGARPTTLVPEPVTASDFGAINVESRGLGIGADGGTAARHVELSGETPGAFVAADHNDESKVELTSQATTATTGAAAQRTAGDDGTDTSAAFAVAQSREVSPIASSGLDSNSTSAATVVAMGAAERAPTGIAVEKERGADPRPSGTVSESRTGGVTVAMEAAAVSMSSGDAAAASSAVVDGSTIRPASGEELADSASATTSAAAASKEAQSPSEASQTDAAQAPCPTSPAGSAVAASSDDATPPSAAAAPAGAASSGLVSGADANEQADGSAAAAAGGEVAPTQTGPISWATKLKQSKMTAPPPKPSSPTVAPQQPLAQQSEFDQVSEGWRRRWWQPPWRGWGSPNIIAWQGKGGGPLRRSDGAAATGWRRL